MEWKIDHEGARTDKTICSISYHCGAYPVELWQLRIMDAATGRDIMDWTTHKSTEDAKRVAEMIDSAYIPGKRLVKRWRDGKLIGAEAVDNELTPA